MRVIYFHQHFVTPTGPGGIRSFAMAKSLISHGHKVTMVCGSISGGNTGLNDEFLSGIRRGVVDGIDVIELDLAYSNADNFIKRSFTFIRYALSSIKIAFTEDYDVLFATTTPLTAGLPGIFARWLRGKRFVFEVRDLWPELPRAMGVIKNPLVLGLMSLLEWLSYHSAHRIVGLSPGIVAGIARKGVPIERICLIPNGCDLNIFAVDVTHWRPASVKNTDLMVVFAGTHGVANGLDAVLDAAVELKRRGRMDIKFLLIGNGKLKKTLQSRALAEGLNNVVFHEPVNKLRLAGLMASADVGLQVLANVPAFYFGTSPNKFFDYIASGLPVLNNYPGWLADMIIENDCGFAVPPNSATAFADVLERAEADRDSLKAMGLRGQALALRNFDRSFLADQWVSWVTGVKT